MTRISNLTTIKIGILKSWNTHWFDSYYYSYLLFNDLKINDYISGIFYKLKIITDYINIYRFVGTSILIKTNLIFLNSINFKSIFIDKLYSFDDSYRLFYNKKSWNIFLSYLKLNGIMNSRGIKLNVMPEYKYYEQNYNLSTIYYCFYKVKSKFLNFIYLLYNGILPINLQSIIYKNASDSKFDTNIDNIYLFNDIINFLNDNTYYSHDNIICTSGSNPYETHKRYNNLNILNLLHYYIISHFYSTEFNTPNKKILNDKKYDLLHVVGNLMNLNIFRTFMLSSLILVFKYLYLLSANLNKIYVFELSNLLCKLLNKDIFISHHIFKGLTYDDLLLNNIRVSVTKSMVNLFRFNVEKSIALFENKNVYFYFSLFMKRIPFILSAKVITDLLVYMVTAGNKVVRSFYYIRNIQRKFYKKRRELEYFFYSKKAEYQDKDKYTKEETKAAIDFFQYVFQLSAKRFPIIGIRIECSGSFKKGKMSRSYHYTNWIKDNTLTGAMPNNTLIADIDYYQYFTILKSSSIGIKTWIFLETYLYNSDNMYIGIIY